MAEARVFFALWPDAESARALHALAVEAAARWGGRASRLETLHLTLAFLGQVAEEKLPALVRLGESICAQPFDLSLDKSGYWAHNRIFWLGAHQAPSPLLAMQASLSKTLKREGFWAPEKAPQPFFPHVTLVRKIVSPVTYLFDIKPLFFRVNAFHLVRSRLSSTGSDYERLASWPLPSTPIP